MTWACSRMARRSSWSGRRRFGCQPRAGGRLRDGGTPTAVCAAIKDIFVDTRSIVEPAGALGVAAIKQYVAQRTRRSGQTYAAAILCGANMNFDRLRFVARAGRGGRGARGACSR